MSRSARPTPPLLLALAFAASPGLAQTASPLPSPTPAGKKAPPGPIQIQAGETLKLRFGILLQPQADWQERPSGGTAQSFFLRRVQLIVAGQLARDLFFLFQTDNPRLGSVNASGDKVVSSGFQLVDAVAEWRLAKAFNLWGGQFYVPTSREALKGSSSQFALDTSPYAYVATAVLGGTAGRDAGFQARGYFLGDRLEYRVGVFQGLRDAASGNPLRTVARVQYGFLDKEVYNLVTYPGANLGKRRVLALGAAVDVQGGYRGLTADAFADFPVPFGSVLGSALYQHLDGGDFAPVLLPESDTFSVEAGAFFSGSRLGPWARYERRSFAEPNAGRGESRILVGVNYYVLGNNLNVKVAWGRTSPKTGNDLDQLTVQLQAAYF